MKIEWKNASIFLLASFTTALVIYFAVDSVFQLEPCKGYVYFVIIVSASVSSVLGIIGLACIFIKKNNDRKR